MDQARHLHAILRLQVAAVSALGTLLAIVAQTATLDHEQVSTIERSINHLSDAINAAQALFQHGEPPSEEKD